MTQLVANQAEMIALQTQGHKFPELVKLLANQANTFLLTIDIDGAVRSDTVSCTTCKKVETRIAEAAMALKIKKTIAAEQRAETEMNSNRQHCSAMLLQPVRRLRLR